MLLGVTIERVRSSQDTRRLLSEARADPLLMSGTMTSSSTVTSKAMFLTHTVGNNPVVIVCSSEPCADERCLRTIPF